MKQASIVKVERGSKSFEEVWELVKEVRSDPECMKALKDLIKSHTS